MILCKLHGYLWQKLQNIFHRLGYNSLCAIAEQTDIPVGPVLDFTAIPCFSLDYTAIPYFSQLPTFSQAHSHWAVLLKSASDPELTVGIVPPAPEAAVT